MCNDFDIFTTTEEYYGEPYEGRDFQYFFYINQFLVYFVALVFNSL